MDKQIATLETLFTLQDETLRKLNEELFRQQQDIARIKRRIEVLENKVAETDDPEHDAGNEKPPHY